MKIILLLVATLFIKNSFSQTSDLFKRKLWGDQKDKMKLQNHFKIDQFKTKPIQHFGDSIVDKSVLKIDLSKEYVNNNRMGADVYRMKPYNMLCLTPDSTFHSNMPVKEFTMVQH